MSSIAKIVNVKGGERQQRVIRVQPAQEIEGRPFSQPGESREHRVAGPSYRGSQ